MGAPASQLHCGSGTKAPATNFDASAVDSAGSDAGATTDAGSGVTSYYQNKKANDVPTYVGGLVFIERLHACTYHSR